jgi:FtsH-binding integral membrane protein|tara:strand:- start:1199 stop:1351 length:153 start_codon:yes stop_codon:yes gene_type:complete
MVVFAAAVGVVLGAMLRRELGEAVWLAMWITLGMVGTALLLAWAMYFVSH